MDLFGIEVGLISYISALLAVLPAMIEREQIARSPLKLATYAMRNALAEAHCVFDVSDRLGPITPAGNLQGVSHTTFRRFKIEMLG